jgi:hypothetical protein
MAQSSNELNKARLNIMNVKENAAEALEARLSGIEKMLHQYLDLHPPKNRDRDYLTLLEAADLLCKSPHTLYGMVSRRKILHRKRGNRLYFIKSELLDWMEEGKRTTV